MKWKKRKKIFCCFDDNFNDDYNLINNNFLNCKLNLHNTHKIYYQFNII